MSGCSIPHRLALLATSPVATGEAKQEEPRKGTETVFPQLLYVLDHPDFKTISPQGDGNPGFKLNVATETIRISKPYPRKGTETKQLPSLSSSLL